MTTTPATFRKKPVEIEAIQWDGFAAGATPIIEWVLSGGGSVNYYCHHDMGCPGTNEGHVLAIQTLEGRMQASPGDWIIRGVKGEFYPCKPDIFAETYDRVEVDALPEVPARIRCDLCKRERTLRHAYDYSPLQVMTGQRLGWYSGDDGEVCPECMTKTIRGI